jgi:glycosyltransferase involved in cell wall biosynthesis
MRILFISAEFPPMQGGVGDCTNEIAKALVSRGVETHVVTTADRQLATVDREGGVHIRRLVAKWDWGALPTVRRAVRDTRADIVHIQYQTGAFGMHPMINFTPRLLTSRPLRPLSPHPNRGSRDGETGRESGVRIVTTFHDLKVPYLFPKAGHMREWVTKVLARSSDAVIATNPEDHLRLETLGLRHLELVPIGSNIPTAPPPNYQRAEWRTRLGVGEKETLLSYFGFLNESKGAETLVRALAQISNAKLLMVGGQVGASDPTNVAYLERVKKLIAELGLRPRVLWTGHTPATEVSANLLASDICVLPYRDGASFRRGSFMAALAHGLPIVTTLPPPRVPPSRAPDPSNSLRSPATHAGQAAQDESGEGEGSRELGVRLPTLRDGENVWLLRPDDPNALADAISRLAPAPDLRAQLSHGALELARHFTWGLIAERHLELYQLLRAKSQVSAKRAHAP